MNAEHPSDTERERVILPEVSATGEDVAEAAETVITETAAAEERRAHARRPWVTPLTIWIEDSRVGGVSLRPIDVTTQDISRGGFSFVYRQYLNPGTTIRTRFEALPDAPVARAVVRNCIHLSGNLHRTGAQFLAR
jgi:hypothetical protein